MSKLIERAKNFFNKASEPKEPEAPPVREVPPAPQLIQKGAKYELVKIEEGNKVTITPVDRPEDAALQVEPSCPSCGARYEGPVGRDCDHCGTSYRQAFLRKLEAAKSPSIAEQNLNTPGYVLGPDAQVARLISQRIESGVGLRCTGLLAGKEMVIGVDAEINHVIILDNGSASFDHGTHINHLYVGDDVDLTFGNDCVVKTMWMVHLKSFKTGANFEIGTQKMISHVRFSEILDNI